MSAVEITLCTELLKCHFGEVVQAVGTYLMKNSTSCFLKMIRAKTKLPMDKVRSSLCVLMQHNMCNFTVKDNGSVEYAIDRRKVMSLLHYPRYTYCAQVMFGDLGKLLIFEILKNGRLTMSCAIQKVMAKLNDQENSECTLEDIKNKFVALVQKKLLQRCPCQIDRGIDLTPSMSVSEKEIFLIPELKLHLLEQNDEETPAKKQKVEFPDAGIYWKINHEKFHNHLRNAEIVSAARKCLDEKASVIVKTVLDLSEDLGKQNLATTVPVTKREILDALPQAVNIDLKDLDSYMCILTDSERNFMSKADDRSGGMFVVNTNKMMKCLVEDTAASVIENRLGSKCSRIFRLLLDKKYLEQKKIEELSMVSPKDVKELFYTMFEESFIVSQDIPRTPDFAPMKIIYLFHVDMNQLCRMLLQRSYKAIYNTMSLAEHHMNKTENKRLVELKQRVERFVQQLAEEGADEEQIEETRSIMTPAQEQQLSNLFAAVQQLEMSELQLSDMVNVLQTWLDTTNKD